MIIYDFFIEIYPFFITQNSLIGEIKLCIQIPKITKVILENISILFHQMHAKDM